MFRLERLGIDRGTMADTVLAIVAQRLIKKLCPFCKKKGPISREEEDMLSPFTDEVPSQVARPGGCLKCNGTGYRSREAVYEVITFDQTVCEMVRSGAPIAEIRAHIRKRGDFLISHHAVEKVRDLICSPGNVFEKVLVEEAELRESKEPEPAGGPELSKTRAVEGKHILIVDDDEDIRMLTEQLLQNRGYRVTVAEDGVDALLQLGKVRFDLIISDVNMPGLDGFKLLEMVSQKGIEVPVVFLTARTALEDKVKGLKLGATDYIMKPVKKETLLPAVENVLGKGTSPA